MKNVRLTPVALAIPALLGLGLVACSKAPPEPSPDKPADTSTAAPAIPALSAAKALSTNAAAAEGGAGATGAAASGEGGVAPSGSGPDDVGYEAPSTWQSAPNPSPMRKATFKIPKVAPDTDDAELTVSSAAGGVDANIKRWEGQFGPQAKAKTEPRNPNGLKVTLVEIKGTFAGGGMMGAAPGTPKKDQMLLGAVVDAGDKQHFFKMVGGEKTITAAKKDFEKFVASFRAK